MVRIVRYERYVGILTYLILWYVKSKLPNFNHMHYNATSVANGTTTQPHREPAVFKLI